MSVETLLSRVTERAKARTLSNESPLRAEVFGVEQLVRHARSLAEAHRVVTQRAANRLLARLDENEQTLRAYNRATQAVDQTRRVTHAAEWLLDNFYLIEEQIQMARRHLPRGYSRELPRLLSGPSAGLPRVYDLVLELISHVDAQIDAEPLRAFIAAYQTISPLKLGELWAIPIMLRLALIENLRRVTSRLMIARHDRDLADLWVERLQKMAEQDPSHLVVVVADMAQSPLPLSSAFVAEFTQRLSRQSPAMHLARTWLEQSLTAQGLYIDQLVHLESQNQAADQVSVSHTINSLRFLGALDWREFVEGLSQGATTRRLDPAGIYEKMEFATRDTYRHSVEAISRYSQLQESEVAQRAVELAEASAQQNGIQDRTAHVGFYLVDKGLATLQRAALIRQPWQTVFERSIRRFPMAFYAGGVCSLTALGTLALIQQTRALEVHGWKLAFFAPVFLLCCSQLAVTVINWLSTRLVKPRLLPRLDFTAGIPLECRTMVVVPTMLTRPAAVDGLVENLEIHYLANRDPNLFFALLTDFQDAPEEFQSADTLLLGRARAGIEMLNAKYASDRPNIFFLFHRPRCWNKVEGVWMGYERKRGKLTEFNALLRGGSKASFSEGGGDPSILHAIKYVITLDTDTQLPRDAARRLVGTMAHPLNRPHFDPKKGVVTEGYSIMQPRVGVSLPSAGRSWFVKLFAGDVGIDPYTRPVSDVYQDVFQEGSFIGKGIYDVDAFQQAVTGRFPDNTVLSHDLIEACHARSALVSDVEFYEEHPSRYNTDINRRHRWIRGDWQIAQWLLPRVPDPDARRIANPLSALSQWKILDNLRRSLVPAALWLLLAGSWLAGFGVAGLLVVASIILLPACLMALVDLFRKAPEVSISLHLRGLVGPFGRQSGQALLTLTFLPYDAFISLDAIGRTLVRLLIVRKRLLEWQTASDAERIERGGAAGFYSTMWIAPTVALACGCFLALAQPSELPMATPILALWLAGPWIAWRISQPIGPWTEPELKPKQVAFLRQTARKTWRFFETFVTEQEHWLPPDNFQEEPVPVLASRTSPTNMGLALLANLAAHDFGYLSAAQLLRRTQDALDTMQRLERHCGHFFNWYDTRTLKPLLPLYISTVDSGNLAGHLFTLGPGLAELSDQPILPIQLFAGLSDTARILHELTGKSTELETLESELARIPTTLQAGFDLLQRVSERATTWVASLEEGSDGEVKWWTQALERNCREHLQDLLFLAPWLVVAPDPVAQISTLLHCEIPNAPAGEALQSSGVVQVINPASRGATGHEAPLAAGDHLHTILATLQGPTLRQVSQLEHSLCPMIEAELHRSSGAADLARIAGRGALSQWLQCLRQAGSRARQRILGLQNLAEQSAKLAEMDFSFLFDSARELFAVGFNVTECRRDASFYYLLASEARLCSYVVVAQGQVSQDHWFSLGRLLVSLRGDPVLASWSGSMFEYLMPLLVMPNYENTLLEATCKGAVRQQIKYGQFRGVPWGVSESGYNRTDVNLNYQYRAFGVPGLGLKRGLAEDLVIAPYATTLALMVAPHEACSNLQQLAADGREGAYGFYEAVDYTPSRLPPGQTSVTIRSFMAHHQGMSLLALAYQLLARPMQRRFMSCPSFKAADLLLQERVPNSTPKVLSEEYELIKSRKFVGDGENL